MQAVPQKFHDMAQGSIIPLDWGLRVSFSKDFDPDVSFFVLNKSLLNGVDVLAPSDDNPLQEWDKYEYHAYDDRVINMEWSRELEFPYSIQSALADITLNNYDDYFTPNSPSPIGSDILPKRPLRIHAGYKTAGIAPQFVGLTQGMAEIDETTKTASFHALDFLAEIFSMDLTKTLAMRDVTTDQVLSVIFQQFGLTPSQYQLSKGRNKIPFLFFERGKDAGNVLRELMQAEMGKLWLDEQGIIRFDHRLVGAQDAVMVLDEHNIIDLKVVDKDEIINTVKIRSTIRRVQNFQPIYTNAEEEGAEAMPQSDPFIVPANSSAFFPDASLDDPALSATVPTIGRKTNTSWFTATRTNGAPVTSGVAITLAELRTSSYVMLFENTNNFPVIIDQVEVWGEPAKVVDVINYRAYDEDSVNKYGERVLEIDNDFFGSYSNCDSFAEFVLDAYKNYAGTLEVEVKGNLALQLGDVIEIDYRHYSGNYRIVKMANALRDKRLEQTVTVRRYTPRHWFELNKSVLNGSDVLAP